MSQSTRQLVSKIQNLVSTPKAHWTPIHQNLANEYITLVAGLADRATVVEFQFEFDGIEEAKIALRHPTDLMEELRLLHFPTNSVWIKMLENRGIHPRPLPEIAPLIQIAQKISSGSSLNLSKKPRKSPPPISGGSGSKSGGKKNPEDSFLDDLELVDDLPVTRRLRNETGFAPKSSPTSIRMLPLALGIVIVSAGLLALAIFGPMLMKPKDKELAQGDKPADNEPLDPQALLIPRNNEPEPPIRNPEPPVAKKDPFPVLKKANNNPLPDAREKPEANPGIPKKNIQPKVEPKAEPVPMEKPPRVPSPGAIQSPDIAKLGTLLDSHGPNGSAVKAMLEMDGDIANQKSLARFLAFIKSDLGLAGRKSLTLPEFFEIAAWQKPLGNEQSILFAPDRLVRCSSGTARGEEELSSWLASAILTPNAFILVDPKRKSIQLDVLLGLAASEQAMADLLNAINKKVISERDPRNGTPTKIAIRYQVMLQQKRDLKSRTNDDLCQDVSNICGELARRLKAIGHPGIK